MVCFFLCNDEPMTADQLATKPGSMKHSQYVVLLAYAQNPGAFQVSMRDACCADPCCCMLGSLGAFNGCSACWARKATLEEFGNGVDDYVCCQGYIPACCCCDFQTMGQGSCFCLCLEARGKPCGTLCDYVRCRE